MRREKEVSKFFVFLFRSGEVIWLRKVRACSQHFFILQDSVFFFKAEHLDAAAGGLPRPCGDCSLCGGSTGRLVVGQLVGGSSGDGGGAKQCWS